MVKPKQTELYWKCAWSINSNGGLSNNRNNVYSLAISCILTKNAFDELQYLINRKQAGMYTNKSETITEIRIKS